MTSTMTFRAIRLIMVPIRSMVTLSDKLMLPDPAGQTEAVAAQDQGLQQECNHAGAFHGSGLRQTGSNLITARVGNAFSRVKLTALIASAVPLHRAIRVGRLSTMAFQTRQALWYPLSPGSNDTPCRSPWKRSTNAWLTTV